MPILFMGTTDWLIKIGCLGFRREDGRKFFIVLSFFLKAYVCFDTRKVY